MRQYRDSIFAFNKLVHWQERIDPPMDSDGYNDTMTLYVHIHPVKADSEQFRHRQIQDRFNRDLEKLNQHRGDSIYKGKRGFYTWWGKSTQIKTIRRMFEFIYFKNCSITYSYWELFDGLKSYDKKVDEEAEEIKNTVVKYLNDQ